MNDLTINYEKKAMEYLDTLNIGKGLSEGQKKTFLEVASAMKLNPFLKEIYPIPYTNKNTGEVTLTLITNYQIYIQRAMATGLLNGWKAWTEGEVIFKQSTDRWGKPCKLVDREKSSLIAKIIIHRKDWSFPYEHECSIKEFCGDSQWNVMPEFMLKKVAIGQGFRLCFPTELLGLPYTQEEVSTFQKIYIVAEQPPVPKTNIKDCLNEVGLRKFKNPDEREDMINKIYKASTKELTEILTELKKLPEFGSEEGVIIEVVNQSTGEVTEDVKPTDNDEMVSIKNDIKKGIDVLAQQKIDRFDTITRQKNSLKQHCGADNLQDCKDIEKLKIYLEWLRAKYRKAKEGVE